MDKIKVNFWEGEKHESFLTLSVKIDEQEEDTTEITRLQKKICDEIKKHISILNDPYNPGEKGGLFKYPKESLHFSLINFLRCSLSFEEFDRLTKKDSNFRDVQEQIEQIIHENLPHQTKTEIFSIYDGDREKKVDTFSLQIFPEQKFIEELVKIEGKIKQRSRIFKFPYYCREDIVMKSHIKNNRRYFVINTLRFMRPDRPKLEEIKEDVINCVNERIHKLNEELVAHPISFEIQKIILTKSDPFLYPNKWLRLRDFTI